MINDELIYSDPVTTLVNKKKIKKNNRDNWIWIFKNSLIIHWSCGSHEAGLVIQPQLHLNMHSNKTINIFYFLNWMTLDSARQKKNNNSLFPFLNLNNLFFFVFLRINFIDVDLNLLYSLSGSNKKNIYIYNNGH